MMWISQAGSAILLLLLDEENTWDTCLAYNWNKTEIPASCTA